MGMTVIKPGEVVLAITLRTWSLLYVLAFLFHVSPSGGLIDATLLCAA